jgi:hypothetical protein
MPRRSEQNQVMFRLSEETMKALKVRAIQDNVSVQSLMESFVTMYLDPDNERIVEIVNRARIIQQETREVSHA